MANDCGVVYRTTGTSSAPSTGLPDAGGQPVMPDGDCCAAVNAAASARRRRFRVLLKQPHAWFDWRLRESGRGEPARSPDASSGR